MAVCDKWVALKIVEFLAVVACLVVKRISADDEVRLSLLLQKLSREWSLLTSVTWDSVGGAFADAVYGGYTIITFGLILGRVFEELQKGKRILEGFMLGIGIILFLVLGGLELASLDSVPEKLVVNASVLGAFSLLVAALFLLDLMGPRMYFSNKHAQTEDSTVKEIKVLKHEPTKTTASQANGHPPQLNNHTKQNGHPPQGNGHLPQDKQNGHIANGKIKDPEKETKKENDDKQTNLFERVPPKHTHDKNEDTVDAGLEKSKYGSLRNEIEGGNYVRLSDPIVEPERLHYEKELAKFNENYFRQYLESTDGRFAVKEDYLPEPQKPLFAKVQSGRLKSLYDDVSPTYEKKRSSKSPTRVRTVATPTLEQLEDYLRASSRSRKSDILYPMESIDEKVHDLEGRASGTPTDRGYVQYAADKWPNKRDLRTPRHSPT